MNTVDISLDTPSITTSSWIETSLTELETMLQDASSLPPASFDTPSLPDDDDCLIIEAKSYVADDDCMIIESKTTTPIGFTEAEIEALLCLDQRLCLESGFDPTLPKPYLAYNFAHKFPEFAKTYLLGEVSE